MNTKTLADDSVRIQPLPFGNGKDGADLTLSGSGDFNTVRVAIAVIGISVGSGLHQTARRTVASFIQAAIGRPACLRLPVPTLGSCTTRSTASSRPEICERAFLHR